MASPKTKQAQMLDDEKVKKYLMNCWRRDQEYREVMAMAPEQRSALLLHGQCLLISRENLRREQAERHETRIDAGS